MTAEKGIFDTTNLKEQIKNVHHIEDAFAISKVIKERQRLKAEVEKAIDDLDNRELGESMASKYRKQGWDIAIEELKKRLGIK